MIEWITKQNKMYINKSQICFFKTYILNSYLSFFFVLYLHVMKFETGGIYFHKNHLFS